MRKGDRWMGMKLRKADRCRCEGLYINALLKMKRIQKEENKTIQYITYIY